MQRWKVGFGLAGGLILVLISVAYSWLGWQQLYASLAVAETPSDLVKTIRMGWYFGGIAILTFGCIALAVFTRVLRDQPVSFLSIRLIALACSVCGLWALATTQNLWVFTLIVASAMLKVATLR